MTLLGNKDIINWLLCRKTDRISILFVASCWSTVLQGFKNFLKCGMKFIRFKTFPALFGLQLFFTTADSSNLKMAVALPNERKINKAEPAIIEPNLNWTQWHRHQNINTDVNPNKCPNVTSRNMNNVFDFTRIQHFSSLNRKIFSCQFLPAASKYSNWKPNSNVNARHV